jgi:hypothetical protein
LWGSGVLATGFLMFLYLIVSKIIEPEYALTNRPVFYIALTLMVIGTLMFIAGFLGELISRNSAGRNHYLIEKKIGVE